MNLTSSFAANPQNRIGAMADLSREMLTFTLGAVEDAVSNVVELKPEQIKPTPEFKDDVDASFITGIATLDADDQPRMLILLDIEKLMASSKTELVARTSQ